MIFLWYIDCNKIPKGGDDMAATVIAISLEKGGVGKTTTTHNLGAELACLGHKVLMVDCDQQGSLTKACGASPITNEQTIAELITAKINKQPLGVNVVQIREKLFLIPSDIRTAQAAAILAAVLMGRDTMLRSIINPLRDEYDFILLDNLPSMGAISLNVLAASDYIILTLQPNPLDYQALPEQIDSIYSVRDSVNPKLEILGLLLTRMKKRKLINEIRDLVQELPVFKTEIPDSIAIPESQKLGIPVREYDAKSKPAIAYKKLALEVLACLNRSNP